MNCEFCRRQEEKNDEGTIIFRINKTSTNEGGEIQCCEIQECVVQIPDREVEINTHIAGQKAIQTQKLQDKYASLKDELAKQEYQGLSDQESVDRLNDKNLGVPEDNPVISSDEAKKCFDLEEYNALSVLQLGRLSAIVAGGNVDLADESTKAIIDAIFPSVTTTRIKMEEKRIVKKTISQNLGHQMGKVEYIERARSI